MAGEESLKALEGLMSEFFSHTTSNHRKREIEDLLNNFSQQRDSWKHCLFFMATTQNEYVMMYCLTVMENVINRQWIGLQTEFRVEIRNTLNQFLLDHHDKVPTFVRNKLVKLVVDIGRLDWPHFYPDFFTTTLQLMQQQETAPLGLMLLLTTSEELACPREDLSVARKEELHKLLLAQIPTIFGILNGILESVLEKHKQLSLATPPPSPTNGGGNGSQRLGIATLSLFSTPPSQDSLLSDMFKSTQKGLQPDALPSLDRTSLQLATLGLHCLSHLFSWVPLSTTITPQLLSTIFHFADFGCEVKVDVTSGSHNSSFTGPGSESVAVVAMCCINELLAKNCVPQEFEEYLLQMFQQTFHLLQKLTRDCNTTANSTGNRLKQLEDCYLDKFTEFLRLFVSIHLRRFEANTLFPVLDFLALLFKYTFKQPNHDGFFACLDIWAVFLDYLTTKLNNRITDRSGILDKYQDALISLVSHVLQNAQFRFNQIQLESLDDETLDDDQETEWQHFLRQSLEIIAKVAELIPSEVFQIIYSPFQEYLAIYLGLESCISSNPEGRKLNVSAENECRKLHCTLRDLSSLLQAVGRLADHFIGEMFMERFNDALPVIERLVHTSAYGTKIRLYEVNCAAATALTADFVEVHAQALAAVKANAAWLAQFHIESQAHEEQKKKSADLITSVLRAVQPLLSKEVPDKIVHSAAHLFLSMFTTLRVPYLLDLDSVQEFYKQTSQGSLNQLNIEVQLLLYRSLSHYLLLPWSNIPDLQQDWDIRGENHKNFLCQLLSDFIQLKHMNLGENKALQAQAKQCVRKTLSILTDLTQSIAVDGVSKSKQICWMSLQDVVHFTLTLFSVYIHQPDVTDEVLGFFLALFQCLRVQIGVPFTEQTIKTFMNMFTREQLTETIQHESSAGSKVVEKFIKILQLIVQEPGPAFKVFLPSIIAICMEQIYPIIAERPSPDIKTTLYELLDELLQNNWRYFFKGSALTALKNQNDEVDNQAQFVSILQSFGQSFLQPDIAVFRQNLETMEKWNSKWKLYHKKIFLELMQSQFLNVLIQVLVHKSHDLLQEEIGITVYNMASIDFEAFYSKFLPQFLTGCEGLDVNQKTILRENFKMDTDLPSFTQSIHRFVNDLRYYQLCNNSLPEGSVKL